MTKNINNNVDGQSRSFPPLFSLCSKQLSVIEHRNKANRRNRRFRHIGLNLGVFIVSSFIFNAFSTEVLALNQSLVADIWYCSSKTRLASLFNESFIAHSYPQQTQIFRNIFILNATVTKTIRNHHSDLMFVKNSFLKT